MRPSRPGNGLRGDGRLRNGGSSAIAHIPPGISVRELLWLLARHPWRHIVQRWNYKSAITSSLFRGALFFSTNLTAGLAAATGALSTEFWFRFITAGCYGALTQAFRRVEPERMGQLGAMIVLPLVGHSLELLVHWLRGTPNLTTSVGVSVLFTIFGTSFNLFAMRRGALIVGEGSSSLLDDFKRIPGLLGEFLLSTSSWFIAKIGSALKRTFMSAAPLVRLKPDPTSSGLASKSKVGSALRRTFTFKRTAKASVEGVRG